MAGPATTTSGPRARDGALVAPTARTGWRGRRRTDDAILAAGRTLVARRLVVGTVGNVSARLGDDVRITPTRSAYDALRRRDLVTVPMDAPADAPARRRASRELPLHLAIYGVRPDAGAIVHTHSVAATAWSFLDEPLLPALEDLEYYGVGEVRTATPAEPGSAELAVNVTAALGGSNAVLLGQHGVLTVGRSVAEALVIAEVIEHQAQVAWTLRGGRPG